MAENGDKRVRAAYREMPREEGPSSSVDDAIRAAARRAVGSRPQGARRWQVPVSIAAVLALAVGVSLQVDREKPLVADGMPVSSGSGEYSLPPAPVETEERRTPVLKEAAPSASTAVPPAREAGKIRENVAPAAPVARRASPEARRIEAESKSFAPEQKTYVADPPPAAAAPQPAFPPALDKAAAPAAAPYEAPVSKPKVAPATVFAPPGAPAPAPSPFSSRPGKAAESAAMREQRTTPHAAPPMAAGASAPAEALRVTPAEALRVAPAAAPRAKSELARDSAAQDKRAMQSPESPERQLERIAELRAKGLDEEADRALAQFRRDHPAYPLSDDWRRKVERP